MAFTSLPYLMDIDWLKEAYRRTRKDGAVGVDGVTAERADGTVDRVHRESRIGRTYHRQFGPLRN